MKEKNEWTYYVLAGVRPRENGRTDSTEVTEGGEGYKNGRTVSWETVEGEVGAA